MLGGTYASFASREVAERLAGSVSGTILPFAWHPDLELIVDPELTTSDYLALAEPRVEPIAG